MRAIGEALRDVPRPRGFELEGLHLHIVGAELGLPQVISPPLVRLRDEFAKCVRFFRRVSSLWTSVSLCVCLCVLVGGWVDGWVSVSVSVCLCVSVCVFC